MEVKNVKAASLCNHEVLHLLNVLKEKPQEQSAPLNKHLATIYYETNHFLQDSGFGDQTASMISNMLLALKEFPVALTKEEKLMIVNYPPTTNLQLSLSSAMEVKAWFYYIRGVSKKYPTLTSGMN
ncbi:hypothetical protein J6590_075580 [Homalodisca vitripennis]|nr:hypothetical protein J6590_075580 [Homalodisca vitripennis]